MSSMMEDQKKPLLTDTESGWKSYKNYERSGSVSRLPISGADLTYQEIRSAASAPSYYPPIHADPITLTDPHSVNSMPRPYDQEIRFQDGYSGNQSNNIGSGSLDEVEIRQLLIDHIGHNLCWASRPARTWKITNVEDCNVYVGTLETFIEERQAVGKTEPYQGGKFDTGTPLGIWKIDLQTNFPPLFTPSMKTVAKIPHSESVTDCTVCHAKGKVPCETCNIGLKPGRYKENQMTQCPVCYGRGLIAHKDGSDTICSHCSGKGQLPCLTCASQGLVTCQCCQGHGSLLNCSMVHVKWTTLSSRKVIAASGAASVPHEIFHSAKGMELCNSQAYQCTPAYFADSYFLNKFSSDVIADRPHIPPTARIICERHTISVVNVHRVTMSHRKQSFSFYIVGLDNDVYIGHYPAKFCWGLCCCFEWIRA
ncbi:hypothetical protein ZOSMA_99G00320 [Zostera marina]|uniref:Uncharacterized protein n=1 Tax=Zostera marina TaxID=29655 RepID=A0A0K9NJ66_ZOSMR|nr:hypothetical protein ZOSMA_99G00320 [Zostera marina]